MGACLSIGAPVHIIEQSDGGEEDYHKQYLEDQVLGEGQFGVVKMVHDVRESAHHAAPLACKVLRKGVVFKDNTLYSPIKPEVLRGEVEILRTLAGKEYCLKMVALFESPKMLYMVTEFCAGGEMMEYVAKQKEDLRTEDVSRIAFQLLSAVNHCAIHHVIHRDIKPENIMFEDPAPRAELRLIDFGSGTMDKPLENGSEPEMHTTFAGSAFYISPEMFQRTYTQRTDVWSAGATLYVLVAGYPADQLQKAFNIMQKSKGRNLKSLPNMPDNMPESYFELLEGLLTYRHKKRPTAGMMMESDFVKFHKELEKDDVELSIGDIAATAAMGSVNGEPTGRSKNRTTSVSLKGSVGRHNLFLGFKMFERSLTTLLATMLSKTELKQLLNLLSDHIGQKIADGVPTVSEHEASGMILNADEEDVSGASTKSTKETKQTLHVIQIRELKAILRDEMKCDNV